MLVSLAGAEERGAAAAAAASSSLASAASAAFSRLAPHSSPISPARVRTYSWPQAPTGPCLIEVSE